MKLLAVLFAVVIACSWLFAAPTAPNGDALNRWVGGKWVGTGQLVDSEFSSANTANAVTTCAWSPDHIFVVCDQDIRFGGTPLRDLSVYSFAPKTGKFYFYGISLGEATPRHTALDVSADGNRWVYSSSDEVKGKTVEYRTTNEFHGADNVQWWTEASSDGGKTWTKTGEGKEVRQK